MQIIIKRIFFIVALCIITLKITAEIFKKAEPFFTIMIDPAGDASHTGRTVGDGFERSITLNYAQELKKRIESQSSSVRVIITRGLGETVAPLQNANFANRLNVDFYLSLHCYSEHGARSRLSLYYFSYGDDFTPKTDAKLFYPYDQAHQVNRETTQKYAQIMKDVLSSNAYNTLFHFDRVRALPFKPLIGIKAPAVAIEMGLKNKQDPLEYLEPLLQAVIAIVSNQVRV